MLKLYATPASIYSAKVRLALSVKGIDWTEIEPPGGYRSDTYRGIVPQGTIPAIDHNGFVLAESDAIIEYLDDIGAGEAALPKDARRRAKARALSRFIDMRVEPAVRALFPLVGRVAPAVSAETLNTALHVLARQDEPHPLFGGDALSLPDFGCLPLFLVIDLLERKLPLAVIRPAWERQYRAAAAEVPGVNPILDRYRAALEDWAATRTEVPA